MFLNKFIGIKRALMLAKFTRRDVNVGIRQDEEGVKIEGTIKSVGRRSFRIRLETGERKRISVSRVEYVEFS